MKTIGANIVLDGEQAYREALKNIASDQKKLSSEMQLTAAQFSGQQNSLETLQKKYATLGDMVEKQKDKISVYASALDSAKEAQKAAAENVDKYEKELAEARKELDNLKNSSDATDEAIAAQAEEVNRLENAWKEASDELQKSDRDINYWQTSLNSAEADLIGLEKELDKTGNYLEEAKTSTDHSAKSIDEFGNEIEDTEKKTSIFGETLKSALASEAIIGAVKAVTGEIKKMADEAINVGSSFEAAMSQVAATMGMSVADIEGGSEAYQLLAESAKQCGATTKYSASEAAEALNYLALAGYDAEKSAATLPKVLNLAAAGGLDLATASDMVTDAMAALNMQTSELDKYIDEMAVTSQKSNTSVRQLGEATLVAAGAVSSTNTDLETMNAELGVLANNGIKGSEGGTHLRNVLLSLAAPTDNAAVALHNLRVETEDAATGDMRNLSDILYDLNAAMEQMGSAERTRTISTIFNKTDIAAVNALLKGTSGEFDYLKRQIELSEGAAKDMADTMNNNLTGKITILKSALEGLGISAYEVFDENLKDGVDAATEAVGKLDDSIKNGELGTSLASFSDAVSELMDKSIDAAMDALPKLIDSLTFVINHLEEIGAIAAGVGTAFLTFKAATTATEVLNAAIALLPPNLTAAEAAQAGLNAVQAISPMGAVAAAAGLLVTGLTLLFDKTGNYTPKVAELNDEQKALVDSMTKVNKAVEDSRDTFAKNESTMQGTRQQANDLIAKLRELEPVAKNDEAKMSELQKTVDQLNTIMPDLKLSVNGVTGELNMSVDAVERYTDALLYQAEVEAYQGRISEILQEQIDLKNELIERENAYIEAQARVDEAFAQRNEAVEAYNEALVNLQNDVEGSSTMEVEALRQAAEAAQEHTEQVALNESQIIGGYKELEGQLESLDGEYATYKELLADTSGYDEAVAALDEMRTETLYYKDTAYEVSGSVAGYLENLGEAYYKAYGEAADSIDKQIGLFDELNTKSSMTVDQMVSSLEGQTKSMDQYVQDLNKASDLVHQGLMEEGMLGDIQELGISGAGYLHELVEAAENDTDKFNEVMKAWEENWEMRDTMAKTMADVQTGYSAAWEEIIGETEDSTEEITGDLEDAGEDWADTTEEAMGEVVKVIEDKSIDTTEAAADLAEDTVDEIENGMGYDVMHRIGTNAGDGLADGLLSKKSAVEKAAEAIASAAANATKKILDINSPSKVFEYYGEMSGEGYAVGMEDSLPRIEQAIGEMKPQESSFTETGASAGSFINQPTINVYPSEGQDEMAIAEEVMKQMDDDYARKEAQWR
ncbi:MAG: phage tail tape measure protein [Lachnospiraceae bacterium]|nr:phage tail tape measure protein [Lachnospiraceae bacterium]